MLLLFVMFLFRCGLFQGTSLPPQEVPQMAVEHWQIAVWALFPFHFSDIFFFFFYDYNFLASTYIQSVGSVMARVERVQAALFS